MCEQGVIFDTGNRLVDKFLGYIIELYNWQSTISSNT